MVKWSKAKDTKHDVKVKKNLTKKQAVAFEREHEKRKSKPKTMAEDAKIDRQILKKIKKKAK